MERIVQTHDFGPHHVVILEHVEDEGTTYSTLVNGQPITDQPLESPPHFEDIVRLYARSQEEAP